MTVQGAHLVGSFPLPDAESTFRTAAGALGDRLRRIPDGEPGIRSYWVLGIGDLLAETPGLERIEGEPQIAHGLYDMRKLRLSPGVSADSLVIAPLRYAEAARESYETFARLRTEGVIPAGTRFQVCLPSPIALTDVFIVDEERAAIEPRVQARLFAELDEIVATIPADDLAIQWDIATEFGLIEYEKAGGDARHRFTPWFDDLWAALSQRAGELADRVPEPVEVGFHLCYGDNGEVHFVQPSDAANIVHYTRALLDAAQRPVTWIHLPVPIDRDDDAYFAPLADLDVPEETELYVGLVHREDGIEGAARRLAAAERSLGRFGVATECGFGRAPQNQLDDILATHVALSAPWAQDAGPRIA